jgi:long-subunit fatty acid transport protein
MATVLRFATWVLWVGAAIAVQSPTAAAYDGFVAPLDEIPITTPWISGARTLGMGGAGIASVEDASAIDLNPAALARMRRVEISGGLSKATDDMSGSAFGDDFGTNLSRTRLSSMRFAYPFPTFRGNLVVGISGNRVHGFDDDFLAAYEDSLTWEESEGEFLTASWAQREDQITEGGVYAWTLAGAFDASPGVSLGASVSYWTGDFSRRFVWSAEDVHDASDVYGSYTISTTSEANVSGFRAKVSGLFYISESLAAGIVIDSPVTLTFEGTERVHEERVYEAAPPSDITYDATYFADELTLPFTLAAGAAYTPNDLLALAADIVYTDWSEMTYEGFLYLEDPTARVRAYEATTDIRVGLEATVPSWPLRLRGGYMTRPIAYQGLEIDQNRSYFTLGAGILVDTVFAIDIAWMGGGFERSGRGYDYSEKVDDTAFIVEAAYRF